MLKSEQATHVARAHTKTRGVECLCELRNWVTQVIDDAEKNGDTRKKNRFLALKAKLDN